MSYQPKTGAKCACKRGVERDNCPTCEGTGWVIDFAAIRARNRARAIDFTELGAACEYAARPWSMMKALGLGQRSWEER